MFWVLVLRKIVFSLLLVGVLVSVWFAGLASAATANNTSAGSGAGLLFYAFKNHKSSGTWPIAVGFIVIGFAVYLYFRPTTGGGKHKSSAFAGGKSPRSYDFLAKIVDDEKRMIYDS